mmetsp:Transcript_5197/g.19028  ORF Transcript_5197/g.19028 Transcript_5197/m.19028 type:complete len:1064 (+) Transcript_5197:324-3515(+)
MMVSTEGAREAKVGPPFGRLGNGAGSKGDSALMRNAEQLFETRSVAEIREVEKRTRAGVNEKQEELKQLVGSSYRDLIRSADAIVTMKQSCSKIAENMKSMRAGLHSVHASSPSVERAVSEHDGLRTRLFAVGARVKFIIDTPEKIWGCLDEQLLFDCADRYLNAYAVYSVLTSNDGNQYSDRLQYFPLLKHQWPLVETFRPQIIKRSSQRLKENVLTADGVTNALGAGVLLEGLDSLQVLSRFLDARRTCLREQLQNHAQRSPADATAICECFIAHVEGVQITVGRIVQLFVGLGESPPALHAVLKETAGEETIRGLPDPTAELELIAARKDEIKDRTSLLELDVLAQAGMEWLKGCAEDALRETQSLLSALPDATTIADVELRVKAATEGCRSLQEFRTELGGVEIQDNKIWAILCQSLFKEQISLWDIIYDHLFTLRTVDLVSEALHVLRVCTNLDRALDSLQPEEVEEGLGRKSDEARAVWESTWDSELDAAHDSLHLTGGEAKTAPNEEPLRRSLNILVANLKKDLDEQLVEVLKSVLHFTEAEHVSSFRKSTLQPHLQQKCLESLDMLVSKLEGLLLGLTSESSSLADMEKSIFIGRLCFTLRSETRAIDLILNSPEQWPSGVDSIRSGRVVGVARSSRTPRGPSTGSSLLSPGSSRGTTPRPGEAALSEPLGKILDRLWEGGMSAHLIWMQTVIKGLGARLESSLATCEGLTTTTAMKGWEETVIKQEDESGGDVEMKLMLPGLPSAHILSYLYSACQEVHRIGGHALELPVLRCFVFKLMEKFLQILKPFQSDMEVMAELGAEITPVRRLAANASEKGLLQLLFDVRFMSDVLSGGADTSKDPPPPRESKTSGHRHKVHAPARPRTAGPAASLLSDLTARLDPIDWATYEQYLWENEKRYYHRCGVLYGTFMQLNRFPTPTKLQKPGLNAETNILNVSTAVPRFTYLPVSLPTLKSGSKDPAGFGVSRNGDFSHQRSGEGKFSFADNADGGYEEDTSSRLRSFMGQAMQMGNLGRFGESLQSLRTFQGNPQSSAMLNALGTEQFKGLFSSFTTKS